MNLILISGIGLIIIIVIVIIIVFVLKNKNLNENKNENNKENKNENKNENNKDEIKTRTPRTPRTTSTNIKNGNNVNMQTNTSSTSSVTTNIKLNTNMNDNQEQQDKNKQQNEQQNEQQKQDEDEEQEQQNEQQNEDEEIEIDSEEYNKALNKEINEYMKSAQFDIKASIKSEQVNGYTKIVRSENEGKEYEVGINFKQTNSSGYVPLVTPAASIDDIKYVLSMYNVIISSLKNKLKYTKIEIESEPKYYHIILSFDNKSDLDNAYSLIDDIIDKNYYGITIADDRVSNVTYSILSCNKELIHKEYQKIINKGYEVAVSMYNIAVFIIPANEIEKAIA